MSIYEILKPQHAQFISYGMHQISFGFFQRGITSEREKTRTRKKHASAIFPWVILIWNFKILALMVLDKRTDRQPETNMPVNFFKVGGIINASIHLVRNGKMRCFIIFKIKICSPTWPTKSFIAQTYIVHLQNVCKRGAGSRGGTIFSKRRRWVARIQYGKIYSNNLENGITVT